MSPELRLISIIGRIQQHTQTEEDRGGLILLGSWEVGVDYHWRGDVASALMKGWSESSKTKEACFKALQKGRRDWQQIEGEPALRILLEGYPYDDDVAKFCVDEITHQDFPFVSLHFDAWRLLSQNFRDHPQIVEAIDGWMPQQEYQEPKVSMAAMVGRTPIAKTKLLSSLNSSSPHWPAGALIEGWGMQDTEVAERLTEIAFGSAAEASQIGYLFPKIIDDSAKCRSRLIELLRDPECKRPDFVMSGLGALGNTEGDTEVVDTVLNLLQNRERGGYGDVITHLIAGYSSDQRVKKLAKQELSERDGSYAAVALACGGDEEMRKRIIEIACPLPVRLRGVIATHLGEAVDETFALSLLKLYDHEQDEEIKTQASISYHKRLKASGQDTKLAVETLSKSIVCYGPDHEERRQAAFCGLALLGRLDVMINAKERIESDRICAIPLNRILSPNIPLIRHILQNWDNIKAALGSEFWDRLSWNSADPLSLWDALCIFADEFSSPRGEAIRFLGDRTERTATPNILRFLGRVRPKSPILLEYCLEALCIGDDQHGRSREGVAVAAELLGTHFGGDSDVLGHIASGSPGMHIDEKVIIALCEGWPESEELERIFEMVHKQRVPMSYATYFQLICRKSSSVVVFDYLMSSFEPHRRGGSRGISRPILRRLEMDNSFCRMLFKRLQNNPTPSEKATIPRLIGVARGVSSELRTWCTEEVNHQLSSKKSPEIGFDLIAGELRPVAHSLQEVLNWGELLHR